MSDLMEKATEQERKVLGEVIAKFLSENRDEIIKRVIERIKAEQEIAAAQ